MEKLAEILMLVEGVEIVNGATDGEFGVLWIDTRGVYRDVKGASIECAIATALSTIKTN